MFTRALAAFVAALSAVVLTLPTSSAQADVFQSIPVNDRDGTSSTGAQAGPYVLRADGNGALIFGSGFSGGLWRSGMEFDLLGTFPQVLEAKLSVLFEVVANPPAGYVVHGYAGDGVVSAADLSTNNPITPVLIAPSTFPPPTVIDVTAYVQQLVTGNQRYAGFVFSGFPGGSGSAIRSSEPFVFAPTLTITAVPEPATAVMLGAGASLVVLGRRRKSRGAC